MKRLPAIKLDPSPDFDLETYMFLAQVDHLESREMLDVLANWEEWLQHLHIYQLGEKKGYLVVYLDEPVEKTIEERWKQSPSEGFKFEALAQAMIMSSLKALLPELNQQSCAPVPEPNKVMKRSLADIGLEFFNTGALSKKYSTITPYPHQGSCSLCYLKDSCPKNMKLDLSSLKPPKAGE